MLTEVLAFFAAALGLPNMGAATAHCSVALVDAPGVRELCRRVTTL